MRADGRVERMLCGPLLLSMFLLLGFSQAEAAYRLTFRNGTSVEVISYEDLGESISYQRFGGTVTVPREQVTAIQELPPAPSAPTPPAPHPQPPSGVPSPSGPAVNPPPSSPPAAARPAPVRTAPSQSPGPFGFLSGTISVFSVVVLILLVASGLVILLRLSTSRAGKEALLPYQKCASLLTSAERSFYGVLCQAVDSRYSVFAKVGLGDLLMIPHGTLNFWTSRNKIDRKHADFVLCAPDDLAPLLVIELDDSSHDRLERRERDFFVDAALDVAGLPILRVPAQHAYAPAEICALINDRMNTDMREVARAC